MENERKYELIISIVDRGYSDVVVDAARSAGASGGTIIHGRGTSKDGDTVLGVSIQPEKEVIMTLTSTDTKAGIMQSICENVNFDKLGMGICFTLPVNQVRGLSRARNTENKETVQEKSNTEEVKKEDK